MKISPIQENFGVIIEGSKDESIFDLERENVINLFKQHSAILFRGYGAEVEDFSKFGDQFGTNYMTYRGGGYVRRSVDGSYIFSVKYDYGRTEQRTFGVPLHGEVYYTRHPPAVCWFYCAVPHEADGGETTICDGAQVYEQLSESTQKLLTAQPLKYMRSYLDGEWQLIYEAEDIDDAADFAANVNGLTVDIDRKHKTLHTEFVTPAIITSRWNKKKTFINNIQTVWWQEESMKRKTSIVRFLDGSPISREVIEEIEAVQERLTIPIRWLKGDFAMVDNTQALHGRYAFTDTTRDVYLRMVRDVDF